MRFGWSNSFVILAAAVAAIALLSLGLPNRPRAVARRANLGDALEFDTMTQALNRARRHGGYWLLNAGFFVCGFHVAFIATHLPAFLSDSGVNPMTGATALSLIGIFNIGGSFLFGYLGDAYPPQVAAHVHLRQPRRGDHALSAAARHRRVGAALWRRDRLPLARHRPADQRHGRRHVWLALPEHALPASSFSATRLGPSWACGWGGRLYDATGTYEVVWAIAIGLSIFAALVHLPISDVSVLGRAEAVGEAA